MVDTAFFSEVTKVPGQDFCGVNITPAADKELFPDVGVLGRRAFVCQA